MPNSTRWRAGTPPPPRVPAWLLRQQLLRPAAPPRTCTSPLPIDAWPMTTAATSRTVASPSTYAFFAASAAATEILCMTRTACCLQARPESCSLNRPNVHIYTHMFMHRHMLKQPLRWTHDSSVPVACGCVALYRSKPATSCISVRHNKCVRPSATSRAFCASTAAARAASCGHHMHTHHSTSACNTSHVVREAAAAAAAATWHVNTHRCCYCCGCAC